MKAIMPSIIPKVTLLPDSEDLNLIQEIHHLKEKLSDQVLILAHHYQRDETFQFSHVSGDSLYLAKMAAQEKKAHYIIFCGVHFMAETADLLSSQHQKVILPNLSAGCSLADMAHIDDVEEAYDQLENILDQTPLPITYINSSAKLKAFCGKHGGIVCTSSNAKAALQWAFDQNRKVFFFPDQHLARNTAHQMGLDLDLCQLWNPHKVLGDLQKKEIQKSKILLWQGHCSVHARFNVQQIFQIRKARPKIRIIVHPECSLEVVQAADDFGSTSYIIDQVKKAPPGTQFAIGTEVNLVHRMAKNFAHENKWIECLNPSVCPCSTMYRTSPEDLYKVLKAIDQKQIIHQISVNPEDRYWAKIALDRMLSLGETRSLL
ncbi:quinolinate synthase NadA [bacterium]|nr:quinolinate synthase NadA [bacterium]